MRAMRWHPKGYGGTRRDPDQVKREGWHEQGLLAVMVDDARLTRPERELVEQLGTTLYGKRAADSPATSGELRVTCVSPLALAVAAAANR